MQSLVGKLALPAKFEGFGLNFDTHTWSFTWRMKEPKDFVFQYTLMALYLVSIVSLKWYVDASASKSGGKYRLPFWFKPVRMAHNIGLFALSVWLFVTQARVLYEHGTFSNFHTAACEVVQTEGTYGLTVFVFIVSKVWEWVDTYFLLMMQKKIIRLHWFHHCTTMHAFVCMSHLPSGKWTFLNAFVHILMYAHYAFPQAWARPVITTLQILQFICGLGFHFYLMYFPTSCFDYVAEGLTYEVASSGVIISIFLVEFLNFFVNNYIRRKPAKSVRQKQE